MTVTKYVCPVCEVRWKIDPTGGQGEISVLCPCCPPPGQLIAQTFEDCCPPVSREGEG